MSHMSHVRNLNHANKFTKSKCIVLGRQWDLCGRPDDGINPARVSGDSGIELGPVGKLRIDLIQIFENRLESSQKKKTFRVDLYIGPAFVLESCAVIIWQC